MPRGRNGLGRDGHGTLMLRAASDRREGKKIFRWEKEDQDQGSERRRERRKARGGKRDNGAQAEPLSCVWKLAHSRATTLRCQSTPTHSSAQLQLRKFRDVASDQLQPPCQGSHRMERFGLLPPGAAWICFVGVAKIKSKTAIRPRSPLTFFYYHNPLPLSRHLETCLRVAKGGRLFLLLQFQGPSASPIYSTGYNRGARSDIDETPTGK